MVRVRQLSRREIPAASRLLARAFANDPFIGHILDQPARRRLAFPPFFRIVLHEHVALGTVYAAELAGRLLGVAAWAPPVARPPRFASRSRIRANVAYVRALFPRAAPKLFAGFQELGREHPQEPHWSLAFVGIEPGAQGQGVGRELLRPILQRADAESRLCYLETPFPATHDFYRRLGFEVTAKKYPAAGAPPVWTMNRQPAGSPVLRSARDVEGRALT